MAASTSTASPAQTATDRLLDQLTEHGDADVDTLVSRYRAGKITLTQFVDQAHDVIRDNADDALDDIEPGKRGNSHVVLYGVLLSTLGGLAMLSDPKRAPDVGETSTMFALSAAAAEYDGTVKPATIEAAHRSLDDRLQTVRDALEAGDISEAQAAAFTETILFNDAWVNYGTEQNSQASDAGMTGAWWETDSPANGCDDCQKREDDSPYAIDELPGIPGDGSTTCGPGCLCEVRYGMLEDEDKALRVTLVKEARCPQCRRLMGRTVNVGAELFCGRCREMKIVSQSGLTRTP